MRVCYICPKGQRVYVEVKDGQEVPATISQPRIHGIYEATPRCAKCAYEKNYDIILPGVNGKFPTLGKMSYCDMVYYQAE